MMNMMNRFVEGRGHRREIDMLLELTCVLRVCQTLTRLTTSFVTVNKLKAARFALLAMRLPGQFKDSCVISDPKSNVA
jgi:hypothetical protein